MTDPNSACSVIDQSTLWTGMDPVEEKVKQVKLKLQIGVGWGGWLDFRSDLETLQNIELVKGQYLKVLRKQLIFLAGNFPWDVFI